MATSTSSRFDWDKVSRTTSLELLRTAYASRPDDLKVISGLNDEQLRGG